ncbi:MAG: hypothetical protein OEY16_12720, partial [Alphaproteobacteria bacterium]|nr:hypothetical protein [Alphaproteobacteria bacterium]
IVLAVAASPAPWAAETHSHDDHAGGVTLTLNHGAKWQVDEIVKSGMTEIRAVMQASLPKIHDNDFSTGDYEALAVNVQGQLDHVVANCKLEPAVDEQFHVVLEQVMEGVAIMEKDGDRHQGAVVIVNALKAYATHFEHPGWQPLVL